MTKDGCIKCNKEMRKSGVTSSIGESIWICMNTECDRYALLSIVRFRE